MKRGIKRKSGWVMLVVAVVVFIAGYGVYQSLHNARAIPPPELRLSGVERLASGESGDGNDGGGGICDSGEGPEPGGGVFATREGKPKNVCCVKGFNFGFTGFDFEFGNRDKCKPGDGKCVPTPCY